MNPATPAADRDTAITCPRGVQRYDRHGDLRQNLPQLLLARIGAGLADKS